MVKTMEANARRNWGPWLDEVCPGMRQRLAAGPAPVVPLPHERPVRRSSPRRISIPRHIPEERSAGEDEDSSDESGTDLSQNDTASPPLVPVKLPTHLKRTSRLSLANDEVRMPMWVAAQKEQLEPAVSDRTFTPLTILTHFC